MSTTMPVPPAAPYAPPAPNSRITRRRMLGLENEFVVCNPTPDPYKLMWGGETLMLPPRHIAVPPHPGGRGFEDVRHSYQLEDGTYLPGTLVVHDIKTQGALGEDIKNWDSAACMRAKIGLDFEGEYGIRGVFWLPAGFSREEFELESAAGLARWQETKLEDARRIVHEVETQASVHRERGLVPPVPPPSYEEAKALLMAAAEKMHTAFADIMQTRGSATIKAGAEEAASFRLAGEVMGLKAVPVRDAPEPRPSIRELMTSDPEFKAEMLAEFREMVQAELRAAKPADEPEHVPQPPAGTLGARPIKDRR